MALWERRRDQSGASTSQGTPSIGARPRLGAAGSTAPGSCTSCVRDCGESVLVGLSHPVSDALFQQPWETHAEYTRLHLSREKHTLPTRKAKRLPAQPCEGWEARNGNYLLLT